MFHSFMASVSVLMSAVHNLSEHTRPEPMCAHVQRPLRNGLVMDGGSSAGVYVRLIQSLFTFHHVQELNKAVQCVSDVMLFHRMRQRERVGEK